jgi:hypothetical protein
VGTFALQGIREPSQKLLLFGVVTVAIYEWLHERV